MVLQCKIYTYLSSRVTSTISFQKNDRKVGCDSFYPYLPIFSPISPIFQAALYVNDAWVRSISFCLCCSQFDSIQGSRPSVCKPLVLAQFLSPPNITIMQIDTFIIQIQQLFYILTFIIIIIIIIVILKFLILPIFLFLCPNYILRKSASSFHWLSSSIFNVCCLFVLHR